MADPATAVAADPQVLEVSSVAAHLDRRAVMPVPVLEVMLVPAVKADLEVFLEVTVGSAVFSVATVVPVPVLEDQAMQV